MTLESSMFLPLVILFEILLLHAKAKVLILADVDTFVVCGVLGPGKAMPSRADSRRQ